VLLGHESIAITERYTAVDDAQLGAAGIRGDVLQVVRECIELLTEAQRQRDKTGREDIGLTVEDVSKIKAALEAADKALSLN
jgi:hypothetical protein